MRSLHVKVLLFLFLAAASSGTQAQWMENGLCVSLLEGAHSPRAVPDGIGGAFLIWGSESIYARRVTGGGLLEWPSRGLDVCPVDVLKSGLSASTDGLGGFLVAWRDFRTGSGGIYAQRVGPDGGLLWGGEGVYCFTDGTPVVASDGRGGAYVFFSSGWETFPGLRVQRIDSNGTPVWEEAGVPVCGPEEGLGFVQVVSYGTGGAVCVWRDGRNGDGSSWDIFAQKIDGSGQAQWEAGGVTVCEGPEFQMYPQAVTDNAGGAVVAWYESGFDGPVWIQAQRIDAEGSRRWGPAGIAVSPPGADGELASVVPDGTGGAILAWRDFRDDPHIIHGDVYAQKLDGSGNALWLRDGIPVAAGPAEQLFPSAVSDGSGGAVIAWVERMEGMSRLRAQSIGPGGTERWRPGGIALCAIEGGIRDIRLVPDGGGGAIAAWRDGRNSGGYDASWALYAMRVLKSGSVVTVLGDYLASVEDGSVLIRWRLEELAAGAEFEVRRAEAGSGAFEDVGGMPLAESDRHFSFMDGTAAPGGSYRYRVDVIDPTGSRTLFETGIVELPGTPPAIPLTLYQNFPNPFNPSTSIRFHLPAACFVTLEVFDPAGSLVATLVRGYLGEGFHTAEWEGLNRDGTPAGSGAYFYRLQAGPGNISRKMILLR